MKTEKEIGIKEEVENYLTYESIDIENFNVSNNEVTGKVIGLIGSKGGAGTTFIACHLAVLCSKKEFENKVILVNLNLENGDIKTVFNPANPVKNLGDLIPILDELSDISVENVVENINSEISVIFSPNDFKKAKEFKEKNLNRIIEILKKSYNYIFLDLPNNLNLSSAKVGINVSDYLIIITLPRYLSIKRCDYLLKEIYSINKRGKIHFIINRSDIFSAIPLKHIEQFLGITITQTIPEDLTLGMMFDQKGIVLSDRTDLSVISSIYKLATTFSNFKINKLKRIN